jgi:hypothetical protein
VEQAVVNIAQGIGVAEDRHWGGPWAEGEPKEPDG